MVQVIHQFEIVVAGPGDANEYRDLVLEAIEAWNTANSSKFGLRMQPLKWEDVKPAFGADPQAVINESFGSRYSALIAVFRKRLGSPTPRESSGTVEEIERAARISNDVMVYFYKGKVSLYDIDTEELEKLKTFERSLRKRGFLGSYKSKNDFRAQMHLHLAKLGHEFYEQIKEPATEPEVFWVTGRGQLEISLDDEAQRRAEYAYNGAAGAIAASRLQYQSRTPLQDGLTRLERSRKACLVLGRPGHSTAAPDYNTIEFNIINVGEYEARDIRASWDEGEGFGPEPTDPKCEVLPPTKSGHGATCTVPLSIRRPPQVPAFTVMKRLERTVKLRVTFRDGLSSGDEAIFTIRLENTADSGSSWQPAEDKSAAELSPLCQFARPETQFAERLPNSDFDSDYQSLISRVHSLGWTVNEVIRTDQGITVVFRRQPGAVGFEGSGDVATPGHTERDAIRNFLLSLGMEGIFTD